MAAWQSPQSHAALQVKVKSLPPYCKYITEIGHKIATTDFICLGI